MFSKKAILQKTISVGKFTALSRLLGMIREMLMARYLGAEALSDVFIAAFAIPNALRKIFAEGALTAAFVPEIVRIIQQGSTVLVGNIMTLSFIIFEGVVLLLCAIIIWYADFVMYIRVPGFSAEQIHYGAEFLRILAPLIFFLSSSSLLAGALHAIGNFTVPALGPIVLNLIFIGSILVCLWYNLPITVLCFGIIVGGFTLFLCHLIAYWRAQFSFNRIRRADFATMYAMLGRFFFSVIAMSTVEIKLFIDSYFASYLAVGSVSLIYYAERFMGIPLGIFATSFATVLLPHLSRVCKEKPNRLSFYLFESCKIVLWVTIPVTLFMGFLASDIFVTLFISKKFSLAHALQAGFILRVYLIGLFNYSMNKILHNFFFSFQATWIPAAISIVSAIINIVLNIILMPYLQAVGLVLASNIAVCGETIAMFVILGYLFKVPIALKRLGLFTVRIIAHSIALFVLFLMLFYGSRCLLITLFPQLTISLLTGLLFWIWVGPLLSIIAILFLITRRACGIELYFLDE